MFIELKVALLSSLGFSTQSSVPVSRFLVFLMVFPPSKSIAGEVLGLLNKTLQFQLPL